MKRLTTLILVLLLSPIILVSQVDKPPIAFPDYYEIWAGQTIDLDILANDVCQDDHPKLIFLVHSDFLNAKINGNMLTYSSRSYHYGVDTLYYRLRDSVNQLVSEQCKIYITIKNEAFATLDKNNISVEFNSLGNNFYNPMESLHTRFIVPKNSGLSPFFTSALWVGGLDENQELHLAADKYILTKESLDFEGGPLVANRDSTFYSKWIKVWKTDRKSINEHQADYKNSSYSTPLSIKNWPSISDTDYGIEQGFAPFIDQNENGIYDPSNGDYPKIRGDAALFYSFNDQIEKHNNTNGIPLGIEVRCMPYVFECEEDSALYNTVFHYFEIHNLSDTSYHDLYIGKFFDFDMGHYYDDFAGTDTSLNSIFVYNADNYDEIGTNYNGYGISPPAFGITMLDHQLSSSMVFSGYSTLGQPNPSPLEYYNNLKGLWKDGSAITYGGNGYGGDLAVNHMYTGDPGDSLAWTELNSNNASNDRSGVFSIGPFTFPPDSVISFELAYVFARDYQGNNISSISILKERIAKIREYYANDATPCGNSFSSTETNSSEELQLKVYPNPAQNELTIDSPVSRTTEYRILNIHGVTVMEGNLKQGKNQIGVSHLNNGLYVIYFTDGKNFYTNKFIKQ